MYTTYMFSTCESLGLDEALPAHSLFLAHIDEICFTLRTVPTHNLQEKITLSLDIDSNYCTPHSIIIQQ